MTDTDLLAEHLQEIWSNWRERTNPCLDCPHWGNGGGKAPHYGVGEITDEHPTVAFVGHEGGSSGTPGLAEIANRDEQKLSDKQVDEIREYIRKSYPEKFENRRIKDLMQTGMCNGDLTENGTPHSRYMRACYDAFRDSSENPYALYFTNIKKCGESYAFHETESKSKKATSQCNKYLTPELEYLDPDIIVPFGNRAAGAVFSNYNFKRDPPSGFDVKHPYDAGGIRSESLKLYETESGTGVVPSIHFSEISVNQNFGQMLAERDDLRDDLSKSDYWDEIVRVADDFLYGG